MDTARTFGKGSKYSNKYGTFVERRGTNSLREKCRQSIFFAQNYEIQRKAILVRNSAHGRTPLFSVRY